MRLYIAGPMTGLPNFNYPAFFEAEEQLRALGHEPINPARVSGEDLDAALDRANGNQGRPTHTWEYYVKEGLKSLLTADGLVVLPDWQGSRGARLEVDTAAKLSMPLYILREGRLRPRIQVIATSGYARSGKDSIGQVFVRNGWIRAAFADRIREALLTLDPLVEGDQRVAALIAEHGWEAGKTMYPEIRQLLQRLGAEVGRDLLGENVWVDLTFATVPDGAKVIVTDCRFPNEAETVKRLGGEIWRVSRPGFLPANAHHSEVALDDWIFDRHFENDGTLEELQHKIEVALQDHAARHGT